MAIGAMSPIRTGAAPSLGGRVVVTWTVLLLAGGLAALAAPPAAAEPGDAAPADAEAPPADAAGLVVVLDADAESKEAVGRLARTLLIRVGSLPVQRRPARVRLVGAEQRIIDDLAQRRVDAEVSALIEIGAGSLHIAERLAAARAAVAPEGALIYVGAGRWPPPEVGEGERFSQTLEAQVARFDAALGDDTWVLSVEQALGFEWRAYCDEGARGAARCVRGERTAQESALDALMDDAFPARALPDSAPAPPPAVDAGPPDAAPPDAGRALAAVPEADPAGLPWAWLLGGLVLIGGLVGLGWRLRADGSADAALRGKLLIEDRFTTDLVYEAILLRPREREYVVQRLPAERGALVAVRVVPVSEGRLRVLAVFDRNGQEEVQEVAGALSVGGEAEFDALRFRHVV